MFDSLSSPIQGSHRLEKYLNLEGFLADSLKIKHALKFTGKSLKCLEKSLNYSKLICLYLVQQMLHQIKAEQFYTNFLVLISPLSQSSISEVEF